jgi:hypothetical protein
VERWKAGGRSEEGSLALSSERKWTSSTMSVVRGMLSPCVAAGWRSGREGEEEKREKKEKRRAEDGQDVALALACGVRRKGTISPLMSPASSVDPSGDTAMLTMPASSEHDHSSLLSQI